MKILNIDFLFTNVPLEGTIYICTYPLFENNKRVEENLKEGKGREFKELLYLVTKESYFIVNGKLYKKIDGVASGSPLGRTLDNIFLVYFAQNWLQNCPSEIFFPKFSKWSRY